MRRRGRLFFSFGVLACVAIAASCREPTQITLRIVTGEKCSDLTGVQIVIGPAASVTQTRFQQRFAAAVTHSCTPDGATNLIGTLVVTPGTSTGTVVVSAGVNAAGAPGPDPADCFDVSVAGRCIIARRSFSFIDHTSLVLPIDLDPLCVGKLCDPASTCFKGTCVDATVSCNDSSCALSGETGNGSGGDASSSDGMYDAEMVDAYDEQASSRDAGGSDAADAGTVAKDSGVDASDAAGTFDAGMPMKCNLALGTCSSGVGTINPGHLCDGTSDVMVECCFCTCLTSAKIVSCEMPNMSGGSCLPAPSCP